MVPDLLAGLNPPQREAVLHGDGPLLVLAGAGSGKTRVLTHRVARLIEDGVPPHAILAITFTNKAAGEMRDRIAQLVGPRARAIWASTFHSACVRILRREAPAAGYASDFSIYDADDQLRLIRRCMVDEDVDPKRFAPRGLQARISDAKNHLRGPEELAALNGSYQDEVAAQVYRRYADALRANGAMDFDDLLMVTAQLMENDPAVRARWQSRFEYVMVDEYQDTNHLQADIVEALCAPDGNVMAVGDDAQSIYGFRGADFRNIMEFPQRFPGARLVTLEENYRSSQAILDVTNAVIAQASERYAKTLFTRRTGGARPQLVPAPDDRWQSLFVRQRILELHEEGVPLSEIAVLFRSSFHSFDLELELARSGVPFVKRGGFRFVETAHVKDVIAHLRVVENPRDAVSWHRILLLLEGVGPKLATAVVEWLAQEDRGVAALGEFPGAPGTRGRGVGTVRQLGAFLATLDARRAPTALVQQVVDWYRPVLERVHRDDAPKRLRDLEQFTALAERYRELAPMLADMALEPPSDSVGDVMAVDVEEGEMLTLSTVHSAKGLEWHSVFVLSVADGRFPSAYSVDEDEIEEERRLLYVACTRARENLILSYPTIVHERALGPVVARVSRFLGELPDGLLEHVTLVDEE